MKTLSLDQIRADPDRLEALIRAGEPVRFIDHGRAVALLTPTRQPSGPGAAHASFSGAELAARLAQFREEVWGGETMTKDESAAMLDRIRAERGPGTRED